MSAVEDARNGIKQTVGIMVVILFAGIVTGVLTHWVEVGDVLWCVGGAEGFLSILLGIDLVWEHTEKNAQL